MATYTDSLGLNASPIFATDIVCTFEAALLITENNDFDPAIHGTLILAATAGFNTVPGPNTLTSSVNLAKTAGFFPNYSISFVASAVANNSLTFTHIPGGHYIYQETVTSTLTFVQVAARSLPTSITQTLTINQVLTTLHIHFAHVASQLNLSQTSSRQMFYNRTFIHTISFSNGMFRNLAFNSQTVFVPGAIGVVKPKKCVVILEVPQRIIMLPCPLLGDGQLFSGGKLDTKKSVVNDWYVYIRHTNLEKLKYTFNMDYKKAKELRDFVANFGSEIIKMINFKGEIWLVLITNQPLEFVAKSRPERTEVTLEFEGIQYG